MTCDIDNMRNRDLKKLLSKLGVSSNSILDRKELKVLAHNAISLSEALNNSNNQAIDDKLYSNLYYTVIFIGLISLIFIAWKPLLEMFNSFVYRMKKEIIYDTHKYAKLLAYCDIIYIDYNNIRDIPAINTNIIIVIMASKYISF